MAIDRKFGKVEIPGIGEDEPVFIIRAKDKFAPDAIRAYGELVYDRSIIGTVTAEWRRGVEEAAIMADSWQVQHPDLVKAPD